MHARRTMAAMLLTGAMFATLVGFTTVASAAEPIEGTPMPVWPPTFPIEMPGATGEETSDSIMDAPTEVGGTPIPIGDEPNEVPIPFVGDGIIFEI